MRLLITGASGYTGGRLARYALAEGWRVAGTYHTTPARVAGVEWHRLDVTDQAGVASVVSTVEPDVVVHTAYRQGDWAVCAEGAAHVAAVATRAGARLVHVSSDAIFAGRPEPYTEADHPAPVYPYGAAKAAAEVAVRALDPYAAVVRTSLIVGDEASKQHRLSLDLALGRVQGALYTDMVRCPVSVDDLAHALLELAASDFAGVLHVAGAEAVTRYELGCLIARHHGAPLPPAGRMPLGAGPGEVRLDISLAQKVLSTRLRGVSELL